MRTLSGESERFRSAAPVAVAAACYAAPFYISDLLGFTFSGGWLPFLFAMLSTLLCLYVSWQVVAGFGELERASGRSLRYDSLRTAWILWAVFDLLTPAALLIPALSFAMLAAAAITSLCFLYLIYRATAE